MYVVFDSNIWISELGLNSSKGAAVRFFINNQKAIVVLPEVIKLETERKLRSELRTYVANLEKNHRQLLTMFGKLKDIVLPSEQEIDDRVAAVFGKCKVELLEVPFTIESARSSFLKTIDKLAPSDKNQQFKDGVIWADCMRLLDTDDVYLITSDSAFYKERNYEKGIAPSLSQEAAPYPNNISLFSNITDFLHSIKTEVQLDEAALVLQFREANNQSINNILSRNSFAVVGEPAVKTDIYATEDPSKLYVEFEIVYSCEDLTDDNRFDAQLILKGDCYYVPTDQKCEDIRNYGEELLYKTKDGEEKSKKNVVLFADSIVIGHKSIEHSVRYRLD